MKKFLFSLVLICIPINVFAFSFNEMSSNVDLEIVPIYNNNILNRFDVDIIINENNSLDEEIIVPNIFNFINNYKKLIPGQDIVINFKIINNSKYNYSYVPNSLVINTDDLSRYGSNNNLKQIGRGFDNFNIYENFMIYRTYNEAISYLYDQDSFEDVYLSDNMLDKKLKYYGYLGISELDDFYIDYFNNKYNLDVDDLNDFTESVAKEIFSGVVSDYRESNSSISSLAYNYYYNSILFYKIIDKYSIGDYMNKNINDKFNNMIVFSNSSYSINDMTIGLNKTFYTDSFNDYGLYGYMEFRLKKNDKYISPPDTGI